MGVIDPHLAGDDFLVDWPVYFVSCPLLNSSRKSEFGESGHWRISTGNVSKIAADPAAFKNATVRYRPKPGWFRSRMAGVLYKPPFAEFVEKRRIRCQRSLPNICQQCGKAVAEWPHFRTGTVRYH